jgi:hypothetical protein
VQDREQKGIQVKLCELHESKIKQYDSTEVNDSDELLELLNEHCSQAVESHLSADGGQIWRGIRRQISSGIYNPGSGERQSENTSNFYTKLFDSNPANSNFPKRSKSFICSTNYYTARSYGRDGATFAVFPFNNSKIGCVNSNDIWDIKADVPSLGLHQIGLTRLNHYLDGILSEPADFNELISLIKDNQEKFVRGFANRANVRFPKDENFEYVSAQLIKDLKKIYTYENIGMTLKDIDNFKCEDSEVWFSDKCIMIEKDQWEKIRANL